MKTGSIVAGAMSAMLLVGTERAENKEEAAKLIRVTDRVYCATGYALGNVIFVLTDLSVVVIDTTESVHAARQILGEFRHVSTLPVSYIIYTHFHGDHILGARVFHGEGTRVIAQRRHGLEMERHAMLEAYNNRVGRLQFGASLPREDRGSRLSEDLSSHLEIQAGDKAPERPAAPGWEDGYVQPDRLFDEEYSFEEGGLRFELYHTQGETTDHLMVWMPGERALCPGDLVYDSFPMLASPMKPDRPVKAWAESLDRMRTFQPRYLVGSHNEPVIGESQADMRLANYAAAIRLVHDETVKGINEGLSLEQIRARVELPPELGELSYLQPGYGRVEWGVNGVYRQYTGWYDFNPSHLNPGPSTQLHSAVVEACGGPAPLARRARRAVSEGDPQLALELTDIMLGAEPGDPEAHALRGEALQRLADTAVNRVDVNIYRAAARDHQAASAE